MPVAGCVAWQEPPLLAFIFSHVLKAVTILAAAVPPCLSGAFPLDAPSCSSLALLPVKKRNAPCCPPLPGGGAAGHAAGTAGVVWQRRCAAVLGGECTIGGGSPCWGVALPACCSAVGLWRCSSRLHISMLPPGLPLCRDPLSHCTCLLSAERGRPAGHTGRRLALVGPGCWRRGSLRHGGRRWVCSDCRVAVLSIRACNCGSWHAAGCLGRSAWLDCDQLPADEPSSCPPC